MELSVFNLIPLGIYFTLILFLGLKKRKDLQGEEYVLLGRQLTLPGFILSLVSSWYGGILGSSEYSYLYGLSNWIVFGFPYYVFAGIFALFLAKKAREKFVFSIPDLIAGEYDERSRFPAGILVLLLASPAPYVLTLGVLVNFIFEVPILWGIVGGGLFSFLYVYRDGLSAIIRTDLFQCGLMFLGYGLVIIFAWIEWGNPISVLKTISVQSPERVDPTGGQAISYVLVWFFIASWTLVSPMFHQRVYALKNKEYSKVGIFSSIILWGIFDFLTTFAGLYAFLQFPDLADPRISHLSLAQVLLPAGLFGLFLTGLFSVVMSTLDSELFVSGVTLGSDILGRNERFKKLGQAKLTRIGMAAVVIISIGFAVWVPSVVSIYFTIGTFAVPGLLLPVLSSSGVLPRLSNSAIRIHLWGVPLVSFSWYLGGVAFFPSLQSIEAFYPGIAFSLILWFYDLISTRYKN